jgi:hypothetical protein
MTTAAARPATAAQLTFINTLLTERVTDAVAALTWADDITTRVEAGTFTTADASATIRTLKAVRKPVTV